MKKLFRILTIAPLLIASVAALYDTVKKIDDDPEIRAAFAELKNKSKVAETLQTIKVQVAVIRSQVKELS